MPPSLIYVPFLILILRLILKLKGEKIEFGDLDH